MKLSKLKDRKAISPVIATVILVAVAITISVAVAYWMGGISSQYTRFEKVEIQSAQCVKGTTYWTITLTLKNSGSASSTLNNVYVNDQIAVTGTGAVAALNSNVTSTSQYTLLSGASKNIAIYVGTGWPVLSPLTSGTTIDIKIHSAGGMDYIKLVQLV
jgi:flagellin-like protein